MSKILIVGPRRPGDQRWPIIVRDDVTGALTGGTSVCSYTELESIAMQTSANIQCSQIVRDQMLAAGLGPKPLFAEDDEAPMLPHADKFAE